MSSIHQENTAFPEFLPSFDASTLASLAASPLAALFEFQNGGCSGVRPAWGQRSGVNKNEFSPALDVFDTPTSYVVHVSLPGAKKQDIGINYDEEKSEIQISGVILRNGDEDFLKTLAIGERDSGLFEKRVRLGDRRNPAAVDTDGITAKLENGVLEVVIPKIERDVIEKKKVRID